MMIERNSYLKTMIKIKENNNSYEENSNFEKSNNYEDKLN